MNRLIALILMISLSCQCLVKLGIITWYEMRKDYVASKLCENKARPAMKCDGKCYLRKQLQKAENAAGAEKGNVQGKTNIKVELAEFLLPEQGLHPGMNVSAEGPDYGTRHLNNPGSAYLTAVFHPPSFLP